MLFKPDEYIVPETLEQALDLLDKHRDNAKVVAGYTTVNELAKRRMIPQVKKLIDIGNLDLGHVLVEEAGVRVGATCTLAELMENKLFRDRPYRAVYEAVRKLLPDQIRNVATIGGSICAGVPNFDPPIALMALDASVKAVSKAGERFIPLENFLLDYFLTVLKPEELVTEVHIPKFQFNTISTFQKLERTAVDLALVNMAFRVTIGDADKCKDVRIFFGGAGRTPMRPRKMEAALTGLPLTDAIEKAKVKEMEEVRFISTVHASADYKKEMARVLLEDALAEIAQDFVS
jgi:carbon-monoxide dehydrogenase medium subunit